MEAEFWEFLELLIAATSIVIDRPKGSCHPRFPDMESTMVDGYLEGTGSMDGAGIDPSGRRRYVPVELKTSSDDIKYLFDLFFLMIFSQDFYSWKQSFGSFWKYWLQPHQS